MVAILFTSLLAVQPTAIAAGDTFSDDTLFMVAALALRNPKVEKDSRSSDTPRSAFGSRQGTWPWPRERLPNLGAWMTPLQLGALTLLISPPPLPPSLTFPLSTFPRSIAHRHRPKQHITHPNQQRPPLCPVLSCLLSRRFLASGPRSSVWTDKQAEPTRVPV